MRTAPLTTWHHLAPFQLQPDQAPFYDALPSTLGGGSIGLIPFHLHGLSCEPPAAAPLTDDDHPDQDRTLLNSAFGHIPYGRSFCLDTDPGVEYLPESIVLDFYGPIAAENPDAPPYKIGLVDAGGDATFDPDYAQWTAFDIVPGPLGGPGRRLVIHGTVFPQILSGHFRIKPRVSGSARLLCAGLLPGAPSTPVADFDYDFVLDDDCNTNGVPDRLESTGLCCIAWPCDPDFNGDGNADQDDLAALVDTLASGNCP
jgi:hypothetical protein